jgi:hypothetical protein
MGADDYLDMPKLLHMRIPYELPPKVRKIYTQLEDEFFSVIGDDKITAVNSGVALWISQAYDRGLAGILCPAWGWAGSYCPILLDLRSRVGQAVVVGCLEEADCQ